MTPRKSTTGTPRLPAGYQVITTSRGRVVTGPPSQQHEKLRRSRSRRTLLIAIALVVVFTAAGVYGLVTSQNHPDSPYNQPRHQSGQDPFGF